jgi:hypothetical protein
VPPDQGQGIVASAIARWPSALEDAVLGTRDPDAIVGLLRTFSGSALGAELDGVTFYRRGVGAVFGLALNDDRRVVVKVHRRDLIPSGIDGCRAVQRRLAARGLPAPMPIGDVRPLGNGLAAAEEMLSMGHIADAHDPQVRGVLAAGLHSFIRAAAPLVGIADVPLERPFHLPPDRLWPTPHDLRFDFTLPGAGWVDEAAAQARSRLDGLASDVVIGHSDWRTENLRLDHGTLVAIFDWDSVCASTEPVLVGGNSAGFTADWDARAFSPYPSPGEMDAFVEAYEAARGSAFGREEREIVRAARLYRLAYMARCEHSDTVQGLFGAAPSDGWLALLRRLT